VGEVKRGKIYVLGLGPGDRANMTEAFLKAIRRAT
jgi:Tetrapyrrole (Corrin/Porphyrin) Methylases.